MKMIRLEIIRVRTLEKTETVREQLINFGRSLVGTRGLISAEVYTGLFYPTDIAIQLFWEEEEGSSQPSRVVVSIVEKMKEFGLVDYTVWRKNEMGNPGPKTAGEWNREMFRKD